MNEILKIAQNPDAQKLWNRCLGRLFAKLGYNLNNPTRGKAVQLLVHLEDRINSGAKLKARETDQNDEIKQMLESFRFNDPYMAAIYKVLNVDYETNKENINDIKKGDNKGKKVKFDEEKSLIKRVKSIFKLKEPAVSF